MEWRPPDPPPPGSGAAAELRFPLSTDVWTRDGLPKVMQEPYLIVLDFEPGSDAVLFRNSVFWQKLDEPVSSKVFFRAVDRKVMRAEQGEAIRSLVHSVLRAHVTSGTVIGHKLRLFETITQSSLSFYREIYYYLPERSPSTTSITVPAMLVQRQSRTKRHAEPDVPPNQRRRAPIARAPLPIAIAHTFTFGFAKPVPEPDIQWRAWWGTFHEHETWKYPPATQAALVQVIFMACNIASTIVDPDMSIANTGTNTSFFVHSPRTRRLSFGVSPADIKAMQDLKQMISGPGMRLRIPAALTISLIAPRPIPNWAGGTWAGESQNGLVHGRCQIHLPSNNSYVDAEFRNTIIHGPGKIEYHDPDGSVPLEFEGEWVDGIRHGPGKEIRRENGKEITIEAVWLQDVATDVRVSERALLPATPPLMETLPEFALTEVLDFAPP